MVLSRRGFVAGALTSVFAPAIIGRSVAAEPGRPLAIPAMLDTSSGISRLEAIGGQTSFLEGPPTDTLGFSQSYMGPVLRLKRGALARISVKNRLNYPVTSHWHGLHVPAILDGGPQLEIKPGRQWDVEIPVDQPAATLWYHSHVHGVTAEQVYAGLAGMIIIDDLEAGDEGLPSDYGVNDIPLVLQDRAFADDGAFFYVKRGPALMHGFRADQIMVNGGIRPKASVPSGLVRLRLLNGSNARIYHLRFSDDREFHQIASDSGLLPKPLKRNSVSLAPAERVEILVDFSSNSRVTLLSGPDLNDPMGGMMGRMMGGMMGSMLPGSPVPSEHGDGEEFEIMSFQPDGATPAKTVQIPSQFASAPKPDFGRPEMTREFVLNMHAGGGMGRGMGRGMGQGGVMGLMSINDSSYDPNRVDLNMRLGRTELWRIRSDEMAHPFHIHGTAFQVISDNGKAVDFATTGLKDVYLVNGEAELIVRVKHEALDAVPFMYHCHILEHEDAGMMGQFTVT